MTSASPLPRVYPILDTATLDRHGLRLVPAAAALLEGGAAILQLRHKAQWARAIFDDARQVAGLCRDARALLIIDDRADFARLLDAGLHVGQNDLPPRDARRLLGAEPLLGFSTHDASQLSATSGEPVDYLGLGPIFPTGSKGNPDPAVGIEQLRRWRPLIAKQLVAIGGITLENAPAVWGAGADSVAVIAGLIPTQPDAQSLRRRMEEWRQLARAL